MKIYITKIPGDSVAVECDDAGDIVVSVEGVVVCKFEPTGPTGFTMTVGGFRSYSNETQLVVIEDALEVEK